MKSSIAQITWFALVGTVGLISASGTGAGILAHATNALTKSETAQSAAVAMRGLAEQFTPGQSDPIEPSNIRLAADTSQDQCTEMAEIEPAFVVPAIAAFPSPPDAVEAPRLSVAIPLNVRYIILQTIGVDRQLRHALVCESRKEPDGSNS